MIKTVVVDLGGVLFSEGKSVALDKLAGRMATTAAWLALSYRLRKAFCYGKVL